MDYEKIGKKVGSILLEHSIYSNDIKLDDPYPFVDRSEWNAKRKLFYKLWYCYNIKNRYIIM